MEKSKYIVRFEGSVPAIELPEKILGGTDAMEFSEITHKYLNEDYSKLIIDLKRVEIMNSSGLGMLVAAFTSAKKLNKKINFINISDKIMKLLEMTHLDKIFLSK